MLFEVKYTGTDGLWSHDNESVVEADSIPAAIVAWNKEQGCVAGDNPTEHYLVTPQNAPVRVVVSRGNRLPDETLHLLSADLPEV